MFQKKRLSVAASVSDTESTDGGSSTPPVALHINNSVDQRSSTPTILPAPSPANAASERIVIVKVSMICIGNVCIDNVW